MEWIGLLQTIFSEKGVYALGWVIGCFYMYKDYKRKEGKDSVIDDMKKESLKELKDNEAGHAEEVKVIREAYDIRIKELSDEYTNNIKETQVKIQEMHEDFIEMLTTQSDRRVDDLKAVTEEYNRMSEIISQTLERLTQAISKKTQEG